MSALKFLDGARQDVVDEVHAQRRGRIELVLDTEVRAVLEHRLDVGIGILEVGGAQVAEAGGTAPDVATVEMPVSA